MFIAGGLYREICETPFWNREFGSGVRAAAAISKLSPGTKLYTYRSFPEGDAISHLGDLGVQVECEKRSADIAFSYFHPLSNPLVIPITRRLEKPLKVVGENVLRFGFLEGTAVVDAQRTVYDPQGSTEIEKFERNGSRSQQLALVLNESELLRYSGASDVETGCKSLLSNGQADVVVVKCGVRGALAFAQGQIHVTPPYLSKRVFKIGTGDIFSSMFAYAWGERRMSVEASSEIASKAVSYYCDVDELPLPEPQSVFRMPINGVTPARVNLRGKTNTLGRRYSLEEARHCLGLLGMNVTTPDLDDHSPTQGNGPETLLILSDGMELTELSHIVSEYPAVRRYVVLDEEERYEAWDAVVIKADFTTALYLSAWPVQPS